MPESDVPFGESMAAMYEMQSEGKIQHVGISNVNPEEVEIALSMGEVATIENLFGHRQRTTVTFAHEGENGGGVKVLSLCEANDIAFWF